MHRATSAPLQKSQGQHRSNVGSEGFLLDIYCNTDVVYDGNGKD